MSVWDSCIRDCLETIYAFQHKKISGNSQTAYSNIKRITGRYYLLNPWNRVLEKLTGFQAVKKFPVFYGTRRLITTFTSSRHLSLSWASSIQSKPHIPLPEEPSQYYLPIYAWVSQVISFPQVPLQNPVYATPPLLSSIRATCPAYLILLHFITRKILGEQYRSLSSSLCSFLHSSLTCPF